MDYLTMSQLKSKFKRLVIEFHHHKNNTSYNRRVVHNPDLSKPLLSLRTSPTVTENHESSRDNCEDQFMEFADLEYIEEEEETESYNHRQDSAVAKVQRGMMGTLKSYILGRPETGDKSQSCHCECHEYKEETHPHKDMYYHLKGCERTCHLTQDETNAGLSQDIMAQLLREGVHYIEIEEKPKKKRFLLLRRLFPGVHMPKFPSRKTEKSTSTSSTLTTLVGTDDTGVADGDHDLEYTTCEGNAAARIQVQSATIDDGVTATEEARTLGPIEVIAVSTGTSTGNHEEQMQGAEDYLDGTTPNAIPFHIRDEMKGSSYSRRQQKPTPSMISLVKVDPETAHEKKLQRPPESWKVVMNDVSLCAALISTGSAPPQQSKSSLNLIADFTSSKHQLKQRNTYHHYQQQGKTQPGLFSNDTITDHDYYHHKYQETSETRTAREQSMEEDLMDMETIVDPRAKENMDSVPLSYRSMKTTTQKIHSLLNTQSQDQSILSGLLLPTESIHSEDGGEGDGDETYDMFLAYDYSDQESEINPVLPLNIRATRIF